MVKKRKKKSGEIVPIPRKTTRLPGNGIPVEIGQWYWVEDEDRENMKKGEFFACITKVGSNFAEFRSPSDSYIRVHFDEFDKKCRPEPDPEKIIRGRAEFYRSALRSGLAKIKAITERLGIEDRVAIAKKAQGKEPTQALALLSDSPDIKGYKKSLIRAKDKDLPKLFEKVEEASESLTIWMGAMAIPARAMTESMKDCIEEIENRIFNVSLYAGLTEKVETISKGTPAPSTEKLRIMQRLLYMDEECLVNYRHGGMDFNHIEDFDEWMAEPENLNRVLYFPRSMVAFRVRREKKDRDWEGSLKTLWINMELADLDEATFLYIRNGDQLYRMNCDLKFGELIFPGKGEADLSRPMMVKLFCDDIQEIITKDAHDELVREWKAEERKYNAWTKANPTKEWIHNPYRSYDHNRVDDYEPFDKSSVYFDEISDEMKRRIRQYNRIALIVQGLFDRSTVLHPHPPISLWKADGFEAAVELIYDGSNVLTRETVPDFEAYRKKCNESLAEGSITIGQDDYWQEREAQRENTRLDNSWRDTGEYRHTRFEPYGNPGPGYTAKVAAWLKKSRKAVYRWERERIRPSRWTSDSDMLPTSVKVPESRLFNVDAYKLGDYKQFYEDVRTRAEYLKWAPMLLAAEEYHSGNVKLKRTRKKKKKRRRKKAKKRQA